MHGKFSEREMSQNFREGMRDMRRGKEFQSTIVLMITINNFLNFYGGVMNRNLLINILIHTYFK